MAFSNLAANRIQVTGYEHNGVQYRKLTKKSWGKLYRSMDNGNSWHRRSAEAFWAAFHSGNLEQLAQSDADYLANGGIVLA